MLFNSIHFAFFFLLFVPVYFLLPQRPRLYFLLLASCYFYMVSIPSYILILWLLILIDYFAARWMEGLSGGKRTLIFSLSLAANLGILGLFKYYDFFVSNISQLLTHFQIPYALPTLAWVLPIGLSFHTFQSLSYTIEVYRGNQKAEKDFLIYSLYVMFWPQLVAGPIERPSHFLPQLHRPTVLDTDRFVLGFQWMLTGLAKKILIADYLSGMVNQVYANPQGYSGAVLCLATYFFCIQIYCDFSGYSNIARGAAKVLGYDLSVNFYYPYLARSISDFWKRWHISLSSWFRDYVYIPLGGNRVTRTRQVLGIFLVFAMSGIWHGANWTYVAWGLYHGALLTLSLLLSPLLEVLSKQIKSLIGARGFAVLATFLTFQLVTFGWVFFRANNLTDAWYIVTHLFQWNAQSLSDLHAWTSLGTKQFLVGLVVVTWPVSKGGLVFLQSGIARWKEDFSFLLYRTLKVCFYYALIFLLYFRGAVTQNEFIYFQF